MSGSTAPCSLAWAGASISRMATGRSRLILAAAFTLAVLLTWGGARAQEPLEDGTRLEPGVNLVGWVGEATPVSQLFDEIPQREVIWAWDTELRDWIVAGRGAPEWLGRLGRVTAGMGLRMQLGGGEPFLWQRSTEPTRGLVKLWTDWNLVAWSGADGTPIDDAVKGIGWSLRSVRRWDAANQQWAVWTSPERSAQLIAAATNAEMPGIRRGEALWVEVTRSVNWLQPTDILPRLVFPGGAPDELQARVREDLEATLAFYRTQYGIQADPDFTIYIAKDVGALIQAYGEDGHSAGSIGDLWNRAAAWASSAAIAVLKQSSWPEDLSMPEVAWARYIITHEYFHLMQRQLRGPRDEDASGSLWLSRWLIEGTASWIDDQHKVLDGEQAWSDLRDGLLSAITNDTPTLRSTESDNAQWEYTLGWLATDQLAANTAPDFPIEFWRQLTPTEIGPHGRWSSTPDWRTVFRRASGQPISEFYAGFDVWQREQAATSPATAGSYEGRRIRGHVTDEHGAAVAGVFIDATGVDGGTATSRTHRTGTAADGSFAVPAPENGEYRLSVRINDDCTRYYSNGQLINDGFPWDDYQEARPIKVSQTDVADINIQLPPGVCGWQIRGRILGPNAEPLAGILVAANSAHDGRIYSSISAADGSFAVTVATLGDYRLQLELADGCSAYYGANRLTDDYNEVVPIQIVNDDIRSLLIGVPEGICTYQIKGSIRQADGEPLAGTQVSACLEIDNSCVSRWAEASTNDNGTFAITVPVEGRYRVSIDHEGCRIYFRPGGLTATLAGRPTAHVEGRDIHLNPRQVPAGLCSKFRGIVLTWNGEPLAASTSALSITITVWRRASEQTAMDALRSLRALASDMTCKLGSKRPLEWMTLAM